MSKYSVVTSEYTYNGRLNVYRCLSIYYTNVISLNNVSLFSSVVVVYFLSSNLFPQSHTLQFHLSQCSQDFHLSHYFLHFCLSDFLTFSISSNSWPFIWISSSNGNISSFHSKLLSVSTWWCGGFYGASFCIGLVWQLMVHCNVRFTAYMYCSCLIILQVDWSWVYF